LSHTSVGAAQTPHTQDLRYVLDLAQHGPADVRLFLTGLEDDTLAAIAAAADAVARVVAAEQINRRFRSLWLAAADHTTDTDAAAVVAEAEVLGEPGAAVEGGEGVQVPPETGEQPAPENWPADDTQVLAAGEQ
jgi:hypothetical protein